MHDEIVGSDILSESKDISDPRESSSSNTINYSCSNDNITRSSQSTSEACHSSHKSPPHSTPLGLQQRETRSKRRHTPPITPLLPRVVQPISDSSYDDADDFQSDKRFKFVTDNRRYRKK